MEHKIIILYIGIAGIRSEDVEYYINEVANRIIPSSINAEILTIPIQSYDTKVECINPKYITDEKLINEHNHLMGELNELLKEQIEILRNEKKDRD